MGRVFKRVRSGVEDPHYTCEWHSGGKTFRKAAFSSKQRSLDLLRQLEDTARSRQLGVTPAGGGSVRGLAGLLADYLASLAARDLDPLYQRNAKTRCEAAIAGCGWGTLGDVRPESLETWLGTLIDPEGRGLSRSSRNGYLRNVRSFVKWACEKEDVRYRLGKVKALNEAVGRRRSKRILTDAELGAVIRAAETARRRWNQQLHGPDRAMLYRVAAYTGIRSSELASLTPASFHHDPVPPVDLVEAEDAKGQREDRIPLPAFLVDLLRPWLAGKKFGKPVWPGTWAETKRQSQWLAMDLKRAGVAAVDDRGRKVLFHSFKRRYVTALIRAGAGIDEVRTLARHKDVRTTLNYYTDANLPQLGRVADRLQAPPPPGE
jgi:integrase